MDNFKKFMNPDMEDDGEYYDEEGYEGYSDFETAPQNTQQAAPQFNTANTQKTGYSAQSGIGGFGSSSLELKVVKPEKYDSQTAEKIANHLLNKRSVVLNLEQTNKESARRLIDFLSGVAFSIGGYIQRVATNTFIIVPENVDVSGEQLQEAKRQEESDLF